MKTRDFYFDLPEHQIAQHPSERRSDSRMMVLNRTGGTITHSYTRDLHRFLEPPMILVRNNTLVRKARVYAEKPTGSRVEFLFINQQDEHHWEVMVSKSAKQRVGDTYAFPGTMSGVITAPGGASNLRILRTSFQIDESYFILHGHIPLPPYIKRDDEEVDAQRYQTVYAKNIGSLAAPTAGLHMTNEMEQMLLNKGINIVDITLHVGLGTFLPIRTENIQDHCMHSESYTIGDQEASLINSAKAQGIPVLALGTTSLRTLEASWNDGGVQPGSSSTNLYITPGYQFKAADALFTNFHTPESTLLVLVCAFGGTETMLSAYRTAVSRGYRFFSYGDAMLIL